MIRVELPYHLRTLAKVEGEIAFDSEAGRGTRVAFSLPVELA